jgi:hypothetical protein
MPKEGSHHDHDHDHHQSPEPQPQSQQRSFFQTLLRSVIQENPKMKDFHQGTRIHSTISLVCVLAVIYFGLVAVPAKRDTLPLDAPNPETNETENEINNAFYSNNDDYSAVSLKIVCFGFCGLVVDNMISALGKHVGPGLVLRRLAQLRLICHAMGMPLFFIPILHLARYHGIIATSAMAYRMIVASCGVSVMEFVSWARYDVQQLKLVDNRQSLYHSSSHLSGTMAYTSGEFLKLVGPVLILILYELVVGFTLVVQGSTTTTIASSGKNTNMWHSGGWIVSSALVGLFTSALNRPDIQLWGEVIFLACIGMSLL